MPTWLITGCSTGLGRALAGAVLARGDTAVVTARDPAAVRDLAATHPDRALALSLDVTDPEQVARAVNEARDRFGGVDVLVNNAGYGYRAAVEEGDDADVQRLFATNLFGPVALIKAVLPDMRARRTGAIVNISSLGARICFAGSGYYAATKAALEAMTSSLRKEVQPLGITVMAVEPGGFRTDFAGRSLTQSAEPIPDYADTAGRRRKEHDTAHGTQPGDPAKAAHAIIAALESPRPPGLLLLGTDAVAAASTILDAERAELETWRTLSTSTDFGSPDRASAADLVWNRACFSQDGGRAGDRHLRALLHVHGMVMNGGASHAAEALTAAELEHGLEACRYFGLEELATVVADLSAAAESDAAELRLNARYRAAVPDDGTIVRAFEVRYALAPDDFDSIR